MAIVLQPFFCIKTKIKYFPGDEYQGDRAEEFEKSGLIEKEEKVELEDKNAAPKRRTKKK